MKATFALFSVFLFIVSLCSCRNTHKEKYPKDKYPKRIYSGGHGERGYMINDSILVTVDGKGVSKSETKVFNLKRQ